MGGTAFFLSRGRSLEASSNLKVLLVELESPSSHPWGGGGGGCSSGLNFYSVWIPRGYNIFQESKEKALLFFPCLWETSRSVLRPQRGRSELLLEDLLVSWAGWGFLVSSLWGGVWSVCSPRKAWAAFQNVGVCSSLRGENTLWLAVCGCPRYLAGTGSSCNSDGPLRAGDTGTRYGVVF